MSDQALCVTRHTLFMGTQVPPPGAGVAYDHSVSVTQVLPTSAGVAYDHSVSVTKVLPPCPGVAYDQALAVCI